MTSKHAFKSLGGAGSPDTPAKSQIITDHWPQKQKEQKQQKRKQTFRNRNGALLWISLAFDYCRIFRCHSAEAKAYFA